MRETSYAFAPLIVVLYFICFPAQLSVLIWWVTAILP